jgi:16S rRNA (guanine(966)-N(2))-methyltransferase RsmD
MRVITGSAKGRKLSAPQGMSVRPTSDMVKEGIFSAIQFDIEGKVFADLFAGTGQLGIEALSRGAGKCYFADNSAESTECVTKNVRICGFEENAVIKTIPASAFLKNLSEQIDVALLDPPYEYNQIAKILPLLSDKVNEIIICEHESGLSLPETTGSFRVSKVYKYGKKSVTIYKKPQARID